MKTILVPIDFSRVSREVVAEAVKLARAIDGRIVLQHAIKPPAIVTDLAPLVGEALKLTAAIERGARQHLRRLQLKLAKSGIEVKTLCEQGFPLPLIVARAKELDARYIVLGSHGHSAFYDLVVGSTAAGVLKRATCPVVVVPAQPKETRRRQPARRSRRQ
jgi:nucleotide-binding universal stress UspA family protein